MWSIIVTIALVIGIACIVIGRKTNNKALKYIGITITIISVLLGFYLFLQAFVSGFIDELLRP